jgi:putative transposase
MPAKNARKFYAPNTFYHAYNRGVDRCSVFIDDRDFRTFIDCLSQRLSVPAPSARIYGAPLNFRDTIQLHGYCLMPNHFHLLLRQTEERAMSRFMRSLMNSYVRYFNLRHRRVGSLFQDKYKAVMIRSPEQLLQTSAYIHRNPTGLEARLEHYPYSSYRHFYARNSPEWLCTQDLPLLTGGYPEYISYVRARPTDRSDLWLDSQKSSL